MRLTLVVYEAVIIHPSESLQGGGMGLRQGKQAFPSVETLGC